MLVVIICTCANNLSFVCLLLMDMKNAAGNIRHIITPIVDPTKPSTYSIFGINIPIIAEKNTIAIVRHLNLTSGI